MKADLCARLDVLETAAEKSNDDSKQLSDEEKSAMLREFLRSLEEKEAAYKALDAAGRIRHWQQQVFEAQEIVAADGGPLEALPKGFKGIDFRENFRACKLKGATDNLAGTFPFRLMEAQLDRLEELGYDAAKLQAWRCTVKRYEKIPWQWRGHYLELPADALALLDQTT